MALQRRAGRQDVLLMDDVHAMKLLIHLLTRTVLWSWVRVVKGIKKGRFDNA